MKIRTLSNSLFFFILILFSCNTKNEIGNKSQIDKLIESKIIQAEAIVDSSYNYGHAKEILIAVLDYEQFHFASDSIRSMAFHKLGNYSYQVNELEDAITLLDSAISIRTSNINISPAANAQSHYIRSLSYDKSSILTKAISDINQAIRLIKSTEYEEETLNSYYLSAAKYYAFSNDYTKAEQYYDYVSKSIEKESEEYAYFATNKAMMYGSLGENDKAKTYYQEAISLLINMPDMKDNLLSARFNLLNLSVLEMDFGDMLRAYKNFEKSFEAKNNHEKNAKLYLFHNLAWEYLAHDDTKNARKNYQSALGFAQQLSKSKYSVDIAEVYEGLGDVDAAEENFEESIQNYHKAIKALCIGLESDNPYALPNINDHVIINLESLQRIMGLKAETISAKYRSTNHIQELESAFELYRSLDDILVKIRQGFQSSSASYNYLEGILPYYEKATEASLELYQKTNDRRYLLHAYSFATKNKSVLLLDGIQNGKAMVAGVPLHILKQEEALQKEIYALNSNINGLTSNSPNPNTDLEQQINLRFEKIREYEDLIFQMESDYPKYYNLKYATSEKVNLDHIRSQLPNGTAVIEYFVGVDNIYSFIYSRSTSLQYMVKEKPSDFTLQCGKFREMVAKDSIYALDTFEAVSNKLYTLLLSDELQYLHVDENIKSLIIIPDDHLFRISFDPLLTNPLPENPDLDWTNELPYLIRKYAISYAYSNKLIFDSNNRMPNRKKYLGFGLEYDDYTLEAFEKLNKTSLEERLTRRIGKLVYSDDEVLESAKIFKGRHFVNEKATKAKFIREAPKANLLHLVTHGFVHQKDPLNSGLVFSKESNSDDFILRAGQLYTMKLDAEMTVLSACHSGYGNLQKGEGIRSLARAFNYAGCPNVTASLWAAPDLSTKEIIVPFYKNIKAGKSKNEALQLSKLDYLDNCMFTKEALPCNWAHLVCIGDAKPLY